ncbi:diacylglycerol kinase family lipid kinase [Filobacillus milosensis]|uniref:Diacylglycerol kinase family lipid kinase n=1 Tax=Filobacillus milosensis TaxID=94137 RepID=A0A4Y8ITA7_9BACI|nr:diacylglycerol kinase family protein [Filobacillus milosensis]TFB25094.1 diacylglycerol kinase family lipid kinase [Filobacillus milosensis]
MYVFIINPAAGNGRGEHIVKKFVEEHRSSTNAFRTYFTEYPGHAEELAQQIATIYHKSIELLFVVGGDGTMYEVLNGLVDFPKVPLSFIPVGSGNDFARGCGMPLKPEENLRETFNQTDLKPYWAGRYIKDFQNERHSHLFASSLGFGFDAEVADRSNRSRIKKWFNKIHLKSLIYVIGLFFTIFKFQPKTIQLNIDGKEHTLSNIWMLTITNHPYFGGGMKIAPNAKINKKRMYVTIVHKISKLKLLLLFLTVFFGKHTMLKEVEILEATKLEIKSKQRLTYHADGYTSYCYQCRVEKEEIERLVQRK